MLTVPFTAVAEVTLKISPFASESFANTSITTVSLTSRDAESETATGASLTPFTVTVTVAVSVPPLPSLKVYVIDVVVEPPAGTLSKPEVVSNSA